MGMRVNPAVQAAIERAEREGRVHDPAADLARKAAEEAAANPDPAEEAQSEKAFQADIVKFAEKQGWTCYHTYNSRKSQEGYPDLTLVRERVVWIEAKTETGVVSAAQQTWHELLNAAGQEAYIFRPKDWPQIVEVLK